MIRSTYTDSRRCSIARFVSKSRGRVVAGYGAYANRKAVAVVLKERNDVKVA